MNDICFLSATETAREIRSGNLSPVQVFEAYQERIEVFNPRLNAIVTMNEGARKSAEQAATDVVRGRPLGPLHGVPFTVKDVFDTAGTRTTRGSMVFSAHVPTRDATVVQRLRQAGGILLGKTNLPEFCLGVESENRIFGRTVNPWDLARTSGGSSGGESAAIAAGLSALGVGSDQGGSVRLPAHYCGIVGFKPTIGRIPLTGHMPESLQRFATTGLMARYVEDVRLGLSVTQGRDDADWYSDVPTTSDAAERPVQSLRIGWIAEDYFGPIAAEVAATVKDAAAHLKRVIDTVIELPIDALPEVDADLLSEGLYRAEGAAYFEQVLAGQDDVLHPSLRAELARATRDLGDYLGAAARVEQLRTAMQALFREIDILLCPTAPIVAPEYGRDHIVVDGEERRLRSVNRALQPFNLCGLPAITVPFGFSAEGLPIGVQLVARKFDEQALLMVAELVERIRPSGAVVLDRCPLWPGVQSETQEPQRKGF